MQVIEGQEVSFKVVVIGYPPPKLQWYHNGEKVAEDYSTELDQNGSLHIPSSEKRHRGVYKLVASNSSGSAEKEVALKVLNEAEAPPPKDVDLSPVPVMEFGSFVANNHKNSNARFKDMYQVCKRINIPLSSCFNCSGLKHTLHYDNVYYMHTHIRAGP